MTRSKSDSSESRAAVDSEPDFEKALEELEALVTRLESGDLSLDESLEHFKRGVALTKNCQSILDEAQKTIDLLSGDDATHASSDVEPGD